MQQEQIPGKRTLLPFRHKNEPPIFPQPDSQAYERRANRWRVTFTLAASSEFIMVPLAGVFAQTGWEFLGAVTIPFIVAGISVRRMLRNEDLASEKRKKEEQRLAPQYGAPEPSYPPVPEIFE